LVHDPVANKEEVWNEYRLNLVDKEAIRNLNGLVLAVPHNIFSSEYDLEFFDTLYSDINKSKVLIDIKGMLDKNECRDRDYLYWSL